MIKLNAWKHMTKTLNTFRTAEQGPRSFLAIVLTYKGMHESYLGAERNTPTTDRLQKTRS